MSDSENCLVCGKEKKNFTSGRFTQWLFSCKCELKKNPDKGFVCLKCTRSAPKEAGREEDNCKCESPMFIPVEELPSVNIKICSRCGKEMATKGSMTQWIFLHGRCQCDKPEVLEKSLDNFIQPGFVGFKDSFWDEEELAVPPDKFPKERFKPLSEIGKGASGVVYLARDKLLGKKVAVKILHDLTAEQLVSFQNEAKATAKLDHPNIVKVLDFGASDGGAPYMVMEYIKAESLRDYIDKFGRLEEEKVTAIFAKLANALQYAHEQGVYHRDIKPSNILIYETSEDLDVRLIDFGVAKVKETSGLTVQYKDKTLAGTPIYMSPDTVAGEAYDARSEVYSLGCVLFETLVGTPPFTGETAFEVLSKHALEKPPHLEDYDVGFSKAMSKVVSKCLEKDKTNRFSSMKDFEAQINAVDQQETAIKSIESGKRTYSYMPAVITVLLAGVLISFVFLSIDRKPEKTVDNKPEKRKELGLSVLLEDVANESHPSFKDFETLEEIPQNRIRFWNNKSVEFRDCDFRGKNADALRNRNFASIEFRRCDLDSRTFESLTELSNLVELRLLNSKFDFKSIRILEPSNLQSLYIYDSFSEADRTPEEVDFESISRLKSLRMLSIALLADEFLNGDKLLLNIKNMENLNSLSIQRVELSRQNFESLCEIKNLSNLSLMLCEFESDSIEALSGAKNLRSLSVSGRKLDRAFFSAIAKLKKLRSFSSHNNTIITEDAFNELAKVPELEKFYISATRLVEPRQGSFNKLNRNLKDLAVADTPTEFLRSIKNFKLEHLKLGGTISSYDLNLLLKQNKVKKLEELSLEVVDASKKADEKVDVSNYRYIQNTHAK